MRKRSPPEVQRGLAPLTIGLGPNFVGGKTTDLVIETSWGERLGETVQSRPALPLGGEPRPIAGYGRERFVYAPLSGVFRTTLEIGVLVERGEEVARIEDTSLRAPLSGMIRGLSRGGVPVSRGTKVVEVDPRGLGAIVRGLGERPRRIAEGVLTAINEATSEDKLNQEG